MNNLNTTPSDLLARARDNSPQIEATPIMTEMAALAEQLGLYHSILDRAERQLDHVLMPVDSKSDAAGRLHEVGSSRMHAEIQALNRQLYALNMRLISLLDRSTV